MKSNRRYLYASIILGIVLILAVLFIYFSSAKFIDTPEIQLPSEHITEQQKIEYENDKILQDIVIDEQNYKEIIEKMQRPELYFMSVLNEIYAYDTKRSLVTSVSVNAEEIVASRENTEYLVQGNVVYITKNEQTVQFDKNDFTNDEIMGIPSYEAILEIEGSATVTKTTLNGEQALEIEIKAEYNEIYTVSLVTGMLMQYEVYSEDELVRNVVITNLVIGEQVL